MGNPSNQALDANPTWIAELIESCRAHTASEMELAQVTAKALYECYEYEETDPHLGRCCELVVQILEQTQSALGLLGIVSHDVAPLLYAKKVAKGCDLQRQSLTCAMHVVRAISAIVGKFEAQGQDQLLLALHDLDSGIQLLVDALRKVGNARSDLDDPVAASPTISCGFLRTEAVTAERSPLNVDALEHVIKNERAELMQIHSMLKCLYEVLLYADDDDSVMHADVAMVSARLINECVVRLDKMVTSLKGEARPDG